MSRVSSWKFACLSAAMLLTAAISLDSAIAQPKPDAKEAKVAKAPAKPKGRLPAHYKDIVDETQKNKIYTLQAEYKTKIEALEAQIAQLTEERDAAIENLLTAEQKEKLKKAKEEATAKRKKPAAEAEATEVKSE